MAEEGVGITFRDREFDLAVRELADNSIRTDVEVLTGQAIRLIRALVRYTRVALRGGPWRAWMRRRGRARAGWWAAWRQLGAFGTPRGVTPDMLSASIANGDGSFRDGRKNINNPFFEMSNHVWYIDVLEQEDNILENATEERFQDMQDEIERRYRQQMARKSG